MPVSPLRLLFVSHDASATGAPNSLLNLLDTLVGSGEIQFRLLLLRGGPLETAFTRRGPCHVIRPEPPWPQSRWGRLQRRLQSRFPRSRPRRWRPTPREESDVRVFLADFPANLIYLNSVAAAPALAYVPGAAPVVTYVRELREYVEHTIQTGWFETLLERTSLFFSVSRASRDYLVREHGLAPSRFEVIPTFVDLARARPPPRLEARQRLLEAVGRNRASAIVVGCGTTDRRKGPDLFIEVAAAFFRRRPNEEVAFVWIGGMALPAERAWINRVLHRAGLSQRVFFVGARPDAAQWLAGADVLALTSREDPFPRVMLEAGLSGIPTVCFQGSGGAEEFVECGTGRAVPFGDTDALAQELDRLLANAALREALGARAREVVLQQHDAVVSARRVLARVRAVASGSRCESDPANLVRGV